jgi:PASTA domain
MASGVIAASLIAAGGAQAATFTLGNPLAGGNYADVSLVGPPASTAMNLTLISGTSAASPVDGTVISWAAGGTNGTYAPTVVRSNGDGSYTGVATGSTVSLNLPSAASPPQPTNLPIKAGQLFELITDGHLFNDSGHGLGGYTNNPLTPGASDVIFGGPDAQNWAFSATIRYCKVPDLIGMSVPKARAALQAADCTLGKITKRKSKKAKKTRVRGQSVPDESNISDTTPIDLVVKKRAKPKRK